MCGSKSGTSKRSPWYPQQLGCPGSSTSDELDNPLQQLSGPCSGHTGRSPQEATGLSLPGWLLRFWGLPLEGLGLDTTDVTKVRRELVHHVPACQGYLEAWINEANEVVSGENH